MTASANIKTPAMDVPLHSTDQARLRGKELRKRFTRVHLSDVSCIAKKKLIIMLVIRLQIE